MNKVEAYIASHWDECVRDQREDRGETIGLPYPYAIPAVGHFEELFYWDTYFLNKGLEESGRRLLAKCNVDDMLYLVDRYGYMQNANKTYYLRNQVSQPPFLSEMVRDVYAYYGDRAWLFAAYHTLKKEYHFWMTERLAPNGLNYYSGRLADPESTKMIAESFRERVGSVDGLSDEEAAQHSICCWESGWDMSPRWGFFGADYNTVDLNCLLYLMEKNMEYFSEELSCGEEALWSGRAEERRKRMEQLFKTESGIWMDYNYKTGKHGEILSCASLYPLFTKAATMEYAQLMAENLSRLEFSYGLSACEKNDAPGVYQWNYPNGWACQQYMAVIGFANYGMTDISVRLAKKYTTLVEKCFEETNNLWEKYNVVEGSVNICQEGTGKMPAMMGWSAGVYLAVKRYLEK